MRWVLLVAGVVLAASSAWAQTAAQDSKRLDALLNFNRCFSPPCDLSAGTKVGGYPILTTASGGGVSDGDKGDVTVSGSGAVWSVDGNVIEELNQSAGETDLRYDATSETYYYDVDGDSSHDTDGTEPSVDMRVVEVPADYSTVQAAIDANDCKKGSTTAHQGCRIVVAPGTYAEVFEIGSTALTSADYQNSIVVEGAGFVGAPWTVGGNNSCVVTFTGNDVLNHDTISVNGSIGWAIRNLCIDMDASATNDTRFGIAIGNGGAVTKHGLIENVSIVDQGASGGAGIRLGDGASADVAFNTIRNIYMRGVRKCVESTGGQVVGNHADNVSCSAPTDSVGGISVVSGQLTIRRPYFTSGADSQILVQIGSEAYNSDIYDPTFEVTHDNVTFVKYPNDVTSGNYRVHNILGGRFQPLSIPTVKHICVDWNRRGQLNVSGVSFESSASASRTCEVNAANPHATQKSEVNWVSNDVVWGAGTGGIVQPAMVFNESSAGGPLQIHKVEQGSVYVGQSGTVVLEGSGLDGNETTLTVTNPTADRAFTIPDANSNAVIPDTGAANNFLTAISSAGVISKAQPAFSDISGSATDGQVSDTLTASTSTLAAANDNDTSIATTSFVQQEIDDGDLLSDNCTLENDATPIPDSCVGNGTDDTSAGAGIVTVEDIDSNPTYTSLTKLSFDQADGFVITNPVATEAQIDAAGMISHTVFGFTGCGNTTDYMGAGSNNANCSATEGNVDITHVGPTMTVGNLKCMQMTDTTCTAVFTIMKNGGASAASAATCTNQASCAASTTTDTIASGDTWSIRVVDNASTCTNGVQVYCSFTGSW